MTTTRRYDDLQARAAESRIIAEDFRRWMQRTQAIAPEIPAAGDDLAELPATMREARIRRAIAVTTVC